MSNSKDRRDFLKLLLAGGAVAVSAPIAAGQEVSNTSRDKISMLTEDGTLVEIDRDLFEKMKTGKKAGNHEIRDFVKLPITKGHDK